LTLDRDFRNGRGVKRRAVLQLSIGLAPLFAGCGYREPAAAPQTGSARVDDSFARLILDSLAQDDAALYAALLEHPALAAIVRHQRLSGNQDVTREALLARILEASRRARPGSGPLDAWARRETELGQYVAAAAVYLPPGVTFDGTLYLVMGYDIGVAAPPDIVLNVAHQRFQSAPSELGFYATHEAHHVGFLTLRPAPELTGLNDPAHLRQVIAFMTQLEGMGVHAAYRLRMQQGRLGADADYRIYTDAAEARRVTARYAELCEMSSRTDSLSNDELGTILTAMSSGERVWYRFGALACWRLERTHGRHALTESIVSPGTFATAVAELTLRDRTTWRRKSTTPGKAFILT
jgi:hypothetical protein